MKADLHIHTWYSYDAHGDIDALFAAAQSNGVSMIAITEHHHARSIPAVRAAAARYPSIRYIPAIEATVNVLDAQFDIVCLDVDVEHPAFIEYERLHIDWQRRMNDGVLAELNKQGIAFTADDMLDYMRSRCSPLIDAVGVTRVGVKPLAKWLVQNGRMDDFDAASTAVATALGGGNPKGPHLRMPPADRVLPLIRTFSRIQSLAHATQYRQGDTLARIEELRAAIGFNALECAHPSIPDDVSKAFRQYCVDNRLLSTAGTDGHNNDDYTTLGSKGEPEWFEEVIERLD